MFLFFRVIEFLVTRDLTSLSKVVSSLSIWLFFTLNHEDKVKWVCGTLYEGYLIANIRSQYLVKEIAIFLRLPIYKAIAAIFWLMLYTNLSLKINLSLH